MTNTTSTSRAFKPSPTLLICSIAALVGVVGLFLPSLSPVQTNSQATGAAEAGQSNIRIVDFGYEGDLVVQRGQSVQVVNEDGVPHTLTADDGSFDSGVIGAGASGSFAVPDADGTFNFICTIHPSMSAELTVSS
jgi:plastocyanin